eukprot:COSAG05_NODE_2805_length_2619_cov_1.669841_2_plen_315_part_00
MRCVPAGCACWLWPWSGCLYYIRHPCTYSRAVGFDTSSFSGVESFSGKGVLGALLDLGGGALLYVFTTHMAAFGSLDGSKQQALEVAAFIDASVQAATALYSGSGRIGVIVTGDFNMQGGDQHPGSEYAVLRSALASPNPTAGALAPWSASDGENSGTVRDLFVEEHGGWAAWRASTSVTGTTMSCVAGSSYTPWPNRTIVCPSGGVLHSNVSLLDYIFAFDDLPFTPHMALATLSASENQVLSYTDPSYNWLSWGGNFSSISLSDHAARAVRLQHPFVPDPLKAGAGTRRAEILASNRLWLALLGLLSCAAAY